MKAEDKDVEGALADDATIRRYLLGQMDASSELSGQLDERLLADDDFAERVGLIEDEIIEEYLDGILDPSDRRAVEQHFLRPPERQEKLRLIRRLSHQRLEAEPGAATQFGAVKSLQGPGWRPHFRTYAELAAGLLIIAGSGFYITALRQGFQSEIATRRYELAQEREHSAKLEESLKEPHSVQQPATVLLSLLQPGVVRDNSSLPMVEIGPSTKQIHIEVRLRDPATGPYEIRLQPADEAGGFPALKRAIWSKTQLQPFKSSDSALLIFDLLVARLKAGKYELFVRQYYSGHIYEMPYSFEVKTSQ